MRPTRVQGASAVSDRQTHHGNSGGERGAFSCLRRLRVAQPCGEADSAEPGVARLHGHEQTPCAKKHACRHAAAGTLLCAASSC